jgi:hypothetical protein
MMYYPEDYHYPEPKKNSKKPPQKKQEPANSWVWLIVMIVVAAFFGWIGKAEGPQSPGDFNSEDTEYQADMMEADSRASDPCVEDILNSVPPEYSRCSDNPAPSEPEYEYEPAADNYTPPDSSSSTCNIKGNISFDGEKIYHVPGQEYYDATVIDTSHGERWFCTEDEARVNGWRKSNK